MIATNSPFSIEKVTLESACTLFPPNRMRIDAETANQKTLEEMTDYYTMWAHQIKTPIFALRLLLQENPTVNKEALTELFKIEQYVEMVLGYLRTEDMSSDLKLSRCALDSIIREQIHKYAGIFISKKLSLTYEGISENVLTDEKWLGFVIGQILSNALKYTRTGCTVVFTPVDSGVAFFEDTWKIFLADTDAGIFDYKCNGRWAYHV